MEFPWKIYKMNLRTRDARGLFKMPIIFIQESDVERETKAAYFTESGSILRKKLHECISSRMNSPISLWTTDYSSIDNLCIKLLSMRLLKLEAHFHTRIDEIEMLKGAISNNEYQKELL